MNDGFKSIFYSEGTGLGKSFIFMRLVQEYFTDKKVLYISYRNEIWNNITSYKEFSLLEAEIDFRCFADFNRSKKIKEYIDYYDVVFIDECHHLTTDIQGKNVDRMCKAMNKQGKYTFGFTATPYVNNTWVDKKYFEVSCYGLDNIEAIEKKLMPKIELTLANINLDEIPEELRPQFDLFGTRTTVDAIVEVYPHITHWLAYFGSITDLEENEIQFRKLLPDFKILKIHSKLSNINEIKKEFEECKGKVILMSVSMLLEGTHISNVGGVLLYRNVQGPHTYAQILGRLNRIGSKDSPVMVDITNAIVNLKTRVSTKSTNADTGRGYIRKDIFKVTSNAYRYIDMIEGLTQAMAKEYRGITWASKADLASKLRVSYNSTMKWFSENKEKSERDYIDYVLSNRKEYQGIVWNEFDELRRFIKCEYKSLDYFLDNNPEMTEVDFVRHVLRTPSDDLYRTMDPQSIIDLRNELYKIDNYDRSTYPSPQSLLEKIEIGEGDLLRLITRIGILNGQIDYILRNNLLTNSESGNILLDIDLEMRGLAHITRFDKQVDFKTDLKDVLILSVNGERYCFPKKIGRVYTDNECKKITKLLSVVVEDTHSRHEREVKIFTFGYFYNAIITNRWSGWFTSIMIGVIYPEDDFDYSEYVMEYLPSPREDAELSPSITRLSNVLDVIKMSLVRGIKGDEAILNDVAQVQNHLENELMDNIDSVASRLPDSEYREFAKGINKAFGEMIIDPSLSFNIRSTNSAVGYTRNIVEGAR